MVITRSSYYRLRASSSSKLNSNGMSPNERKNFEAYLLKKYNFKSVSVETKSIAAAVRIPNARTKRHRFNKNTYASIDKFLIQFPNPSAKLRARLAKDINVPLKRLSKFISYRRWQKTKNPNVTYPFLKNIIFI